MRRAQGSSSGEFAGRQTNTRAREGVLPTPPGSYGPSIKQTVHRWVAGNIQPVNRGAQEWLHQIVFQSVTAQHGSRRNRVRTRLHRNPDTQPLVNVRPKSARIRRHLNEVWTAADSDRTHPLLVHGNLDLVRIFHSAHQIESVAPQTNLDHVLAIHREVMPDQNSAPRSRRQSFYMLVLRKIGTNPVRCRGRCHVRVSNRQPADVPGRRQVAFHQRRRNPQDVGDVIETAALIVRWKDRRGIDLQPQKVADRVGVLRTVQAMHGGFARIRLGRRRAVQRSL